jgi:hypothetical protein
LIASLPAAGADAPDTAGSVTTAVESVVTTAVESTATAVESVFTSVEAPPQAANVAIATIAITFLIIVFYFYSL